MFKIIRDGLLVNVSNAHHPSDPDDFPSIDIQVEKGSKASEDANLVVNSPRAAP